MNASFIQNEIKWDRIIHFSIKCRFFQKWGKRAKANFIQKVETADKTFVFIEVREQGGGKFVGNGCVFYLCY